MRVNLSADERPQRQNVRALEIGELYECLAHAAPFIRRVFAVESAAMLGIAQLSIQPVKQPRKVQMFSKTYCAVMPPSAVMIEPVRNEASSLAKNSARCAISRGSPGRPIGWKLSMFA